MGIAGDGIRRPTTVRIYLDGRYEPLRDVRLAIVRLDILPDRVEDLPCRSSNYPSSYRQLRIGH